MPARSSPSTSSRTTRTARRSGQLEKTFAGSKGTVRLDYDGQSVTDPALADQVLAELTGIPTEAFFRSTASVRHHELANLGHDEGTLRDRLQASISGGDRGTSRAKRKLEVAIHGLITKGDKNPGALKVAEAAVARSGQALEQGDLALAQLARDRDALAGALERRAEAEAGLAERRGMLEKARQAERLATERDAAQDRYERFRQAVEVNDQIAVLAATHPSANALPVLRSGVERVRALDQKARELRAALAGNVAGHLRGRGRAELAPAVALGHRPDDHRRRHRRRLDRARSPRHRAIRARSRASSAAIIGAIGLVLAAVALWMRRSDHMGAELRDTEIDRRLRGRSEIEAELALVEAESAQRLGALGLEDLATAEDMLTREEAHVARIDRARRPSSRGSSASNRPSRSCRRATPQRWRSPRRTAHSRRSGRSPRSPVPGSASKSRSGTRRPRSRVPVTTRRMPGPGWRRTLSMPKRWRPTPNRLASWSEELAALQRRQRVYTMTLETIVKAEQATMKSATVYLEKRMVRDLEGATAGRYRHVRVDDKTLDIEVRAPEKRDWVKVTALSQGTMDLVYLTARLGLVRLVTGDRRPPLIFDDPFVTLDDVRAARALTLLKGITTDFQVIYLTCSERYDGVADAIVELPGPTAVDDEAPPEGSGP